MQKTPFPFIALRGSALLALTALSLVAPVAAAQEYEQRVSARGLSVRAAGQLTLNTSQLAFRDLTVGQVSATQSALLTNTGVAELGIRGAAISGGDGYGGFYLAGLTCPEVLQPGQSCSVSVFAVGQTSNRTGYLNIGVSNSNTSTHRVQLTSSTGEGQAELTLSSTSVNFGSVATNTTHTREVLAHNSGSGVLSWSAAPAVSGNAAYGAGSTSCGETLAAGASCTTEVTFTPTETGTFNGTLTFTSTLANSPHQVSLVLATGLKC